MNGEQVNTPDESIIRVQGAEGVEVLRISPDGAIFWRGVPVEGNDDFKAAMLDMAVAMRSLTDPRFGPEYVALRNQAITMRGQIEALLNEKQNLLSTIARQAGRLENLTDQMRGVQ